MVSPLVHSSLLAVLRHSFRQPQWAAPGTMPAAEKIPAAVLMPIIVRETGLTMLLTQRTAHLHDHAGQISFPGGRCETFDISPVNTALREAQEEVGLNPAQIEVLGCMPEYHTSTGFCITPVAALVTPPLNLQIDDFEVAQVFEVPLDFLLNPAHQEQHKKEYKGAWHEYWAIPWQNHHIWGATAEMLVNLGRLLATNAKSQPTIINFDTEQP